MEIFFVQMAKVASDPGIIIKADSHPAKMAIRQRDIFRYPE
jgi:hypothetical protein